MQETKRFEDILNKACSLSASADRDAFGGKCSASLKSASFDHGSGELDISLEMNFVMNYCIYRHMRNRIQNCLPFVKNIRCRVDYRDIDAGTADVFRGYLPGAAESVLAGGEYDGLMRRMGHRARGIGFALYLDRLEDRERERQWDVDVLLLCDRESDAAAIRAQVKELNDKGLSVSVQNAIPEKLRCREILDRRGEAARC